MEQPVPEATNGKKTARQWLFGVNALALAWMRQLLKFNEGLPPQVCALPPPAPSLAEIRQRD
jgi:hypothetical protein